MSQKQSLKHLIESQIICENFDADRFSRIITKFAIGHAGYEFDNLNFDGPSGVWYDFSPNISDEIKTEFENPTIMTVIPNISSRFSCNECIFQNIETGEAFALSKLICIQDQRYSYNVVLTESGGVSVKMIILDFLYCKVDFE